MTIYIIYSTFFPQERDYNYLKIFFTILFFTYFFLNLSLSTYYIIMSRKAHFYVNKIARKNCIMQTWN